MGKNKQDILEESEIVETTTKLIFGLLKLAEILKSNLKILITGTAGFHLAKKLLERGDEVVGIDNNVMLNDEFLIFNEISINNNSKLKIAPLGNALGVHHSKLYKNPHAYIQSNVVGFLNILEGCRNNGVKNRAFASSSSVYGLKAS